MRVDHSVAAGSHHLLPSPDHHPWHTCGMASKKLEMYRRDGVEARSNGSCELLLENHQLRWALMEMKELDPRENERRNV